MKVAKLNSPPILDSIPDDIPVKQCKIKAVGAVNNSNLSGTPKGIVADINKYNFPKSIKTRACLIYSQLELPSDRRTLGRLKIIAYCIHQAYTQLVCPGAVDAVYIGEKIGMTKSESNAAIGHRPKYKPGFKATSPMVKLSDMVRGYAEHVFDLGEYTAEDMVGEFEAMTINDQSLLVEQAKTLVAAFIMYYMETNSAKVDKEHFSAVFYLDYTTIRSLYQRVVKAACM
jgi:hypothetical protein